MKEAGEYQCLVSVFLLGEFISLMNIIVLLPLAPSVPPSQPLVTGLTFDTVDLS